MDNATLKKRRRFIGMMSVVVIGILFIGLAWLGFHLVLENIRTPEQFQKYIESFGWNGRFVFLGIQILQVIIALIPGELVEVGAGYAFGPLEGTVLCISGVAIASIAIFLLVKKWGIRLVELFADSKKIDELKFINSESKLKRTIFLLYFIPGTPKDLLTYFAGLTRIRLHEFMVISMIARIPSIVSSTVGGHILGNSDYKSAIILFVITGVVSLAGMLVYSKMIKIRSRRREERREPDNVK